MRTAREVWSQSELKTGGLYELAIEVSDNKKSRKWVEAAINSIYELEFIQGPFDHELNAATLYLDMDFGYSENFGVLNLEDYQLPFRLIFTSEDTNVGSNWIDVCFYTGIYEEILGKEYTTWDTNPNCHEEFDNCLLQILNHIYYSNKVRLGIIGWEVSGMYHLQSLKKAPLSEESLSLAKFYVNEDEELEVSNGEAVNKLKIREPKEA